MLDKIWDKKWTTFWPKNGQHFGQKIGQTFWKLLEVGGGGRGAVRLLRSRRRTVLFSLVDGQAKIHFQKLASAILISHFSKTPLLVSLISAQKVNSKRCWYSLNRSQNCSELWTLFCVCGCDVGNRSVQCVSLL